MTFETEVVKDGIGRCIRVDVSTDKFSTIAARWGTVAGLLDGTNEYSSRVLSVGSVRRGLGHQRVATAGTTELVLDNTDGALDNYATYQSMSTIAKFRARIYVVLFTPGATPASADSKLLGEFSMSSWARRTNTTLRMELADDVMGNVSQQAVLPTLADWEAIGTTANNPIKNGFGRPDSLDGEGVVPIQIAFGEDWLLAMPHLLPIGTVDAAYQNKMIVPICCTSSTDASVATDCTSLRIMLGGQGGSGGVRWVDVPTSYWDDVNRIDGEIWRVERSPTITKDGRSWKVIYLVVRADLGVLSWDFSWLRGGGVRNNGDPVTFSYDSPQYSMEAMGGYPWTSLFTMRGYVDNDPSQPQYANIGSGVLAWYVKGFPLSARTQTTAAAQHPVDVLTDLATYYSASTTITVDSTAAGRVKAGNPWSACFGVIQPWTERANNPTVFSPPPSLRQAISKLAQSGDLDVFINWAGQFSFSSDVRDFTVVTTVASALAIEEEQTSHVEDWLPANGERWAAYNRLFFTGGRPYPAEQRDVPFQGPFDFEVGETGISIADRIIEASVEQGWRVWYQQAIRPISWRQLDYSARPMIRFRYNIGALQLELGSYFRMAWTRGTEVAGPYPDTVFQCESITYAPGDDSVEVEAIWRGDIEEENSYLLDDESLLVRSKGGLSGSCTENAVAELFDFGGTINLTTIGVTAGDILLIREASEAADTFLYNRAYRIAVVTSSTRVEVIGGHTETAHVTANADWSILRGFTTYPTAVGDPTNYPSGSLMYGKVTDSGGLYSDSSDGNILLSG